jgi:CHAD domain-containing protein
MWGAKPSTSYGFERDESVRDAFARCAHEQLDRALWELNEGVEADPVEAVHAARKAVKKERALLRIVHGSIRASNRRRENDALRGAARAFSDVRDAEALVEAVDKLSERFAGQLPEVTFTAIRDHLEHQSTGAHAQLHDPAWTAGPISDLRLARERIGQLPLRRGGWDGLESGLLRTYGRGRQARSLARRAPTDENLHRWRKRAKDLWYHLKLLAPVAGQTIGGQAKDAHRLADLLGDDHDLAVLRQTLARSGGKLAIDLDAVLSLIDYRRDQLQLEARLAGERVYAERPKAFRRRVRRQWKAGRAEGRAPRARTPAELAQATRATVRT